MLTAIRFPGPVPPGLELPGLLGDIACTLGTWAWSWESEPPKLPIDDCAAPTTGDPRPDWGVDHVVVATPDLDATVAALTAAGGDDRRRGETRRGQRAAFVLAGTLVEVVELGSATRLVGIAFETDLDLCDVADRWRQDGLPVTDPHPAVQAGRSILSALGSPVAVMDRR